MFFFSANVVENLRYPVADHGGKVSGQTLGVGQKTAGRLGEETRG